MEISYIFHQGCVPVKVAARVYGKDASWIRAGLITGYLPIGFATKDLIRITDIDEMRKGGRINYHISPKKLYEDTGYIWRGERE